MTAFAITPLEVIQDRRLLASDLRVLLGLLTFADRQTLECFPRRETLATRIGLSVTRVGQVLTRLSSLGWIERTRTGRATTYRITPPGSHQEAAPDALQTPSSATRKPLDQETQGFPSDSKDGVAFASIEGTDYLSDHLPSPLALATTPDSATPIDQERQQAAAAARQQQEEQQQARQRQREREERQQRHLARQEARQQRKEQRNAERAQRSEAAQNAVQRVLDVFRDVCNVQYPNSGAIATRVANAIERHGEEVLVRVIRHRGPSFRYPLALLKSELIESISAELERPAPQEGSQEGKPKERRVYGVPVSLIEREARPGETLEDAALRIYEQRRNSVMRA